MSTKTQRRRGSADIGLIIRRESKRLELRNPKPDSRRRGSTGDGFGNSWKQEKRRRSLNYGDMKGWKYEQQKSANDLEHGQYHRQLKRRSSTGSAVMLKHYKRTSELQEQIEEELKKMKKERSHQENKAWMKIIENNKEWREENNETEGALEKLICNMTRYFNILLLHKKICITSIIVFFLLTILGLTLVLVNAKKYEYALINHATHVAERVENILQQEIEKSLRPLYTLSSFVQRLDTFDELATELLSSEKNSLLNMMDMQRICENKTYTRAFNEIASSIEEGAKMGGVLVNLQLAPHGRVCLTYPEERSFIFVDKKLTIESNPIGLDLLVHSQTAAMNAIRKNGISLVGPLPLVNENNLSATELIIAHFNVKNQHYEIKINSTNYQSWGLALAVLNWSKVKEKIGLNDLFSKQKMEFNISTSSIINKFNSTSSKMTLASSENIYLLNENDVLFFEINLPFNNWTLCVGYQSGFTAPYKIWGSILAIFVSFLISFMLATALVSRQMYEALLYKTLPKRMIKKMQKGKSVVENYKLATVFYSDIVGFTKLSGSMNPLDVMSMLNEMYCHFDELVAKYKICKVETIGDAYICIGGGSDDMFGVRGEERVALFALEAIEFVKGLRTRTGLSIQIRAGIATGPFIACVIGKTIPKLTLFGSTCHLAEHLESSSETMKIQCSDITMGLLKDSLNYDFDLQKRYSDDDLAENSNLVQTYYLSGFCEYEDDAEIFSQDFEAGFHLNPIDKIHDCSDKAVNAILLKFGFKEEQSDEKFAQILNVSVHSEMSLDSSLDGSAGSIYSNSQRMKKNRQSRQNKENPDKNNLNMTSLTSYWVSSARKGEIKDNQNASLGSSWNGPKSYITYQKTKLQKLWKSFKSSLKATVQTARTNPELIRFTLASFVIFCGVGLMTVLISAEKNERLQELYVLAFAEDMANAIAREFEKGILPLFSLAEFVKRLKLFDTLPNSLNQSLIGNANIGNKEYKICSDKKFRKPYEDIALGIEKASNMIGNLFALFLEPAAIACLAYPMIVKENDKILMNNSDLVGRSVLKNRNTSLLLNDLITSTVVTFEDPSLLKEREVNAHEETFFARIPVVKEGFTMIIENKTYPFWGFVSIRLNWRFMKEHLKLYELFESENIEFKMTKLTHNSKINEMIVVAQSNNSDYLNAKNSIQFQVPITNEDWVLIAGYKSGFAPDWKIPACIGVIINAILCSTLFFISIVSRLEQKMLLNRMFPKHVIKKLQEGKTVIEKYESATICFCRIVNFTDMNIPPKDAMEMLNEIDDEFDKIASRCKVHKVETIGDTYLVVGGGPDKSSPVEGAGNIAYFALDCIKFIEGYSRNGVGVRIRVGLINGAIVAGVVGTTMPKYAMCGDTVNFASRMESTGLPMQVQCNDKTKDLLLQSRRYRFRFEQRVDGDKVGVYCKGKGSVETYWIRGVKILEEFEENI